MIALNIENTKNFMSKLLGTQAFDDFLLEEATIKTYNTFNIDGRVIPEFYDDYEFGYEFSTWKDIRPICFDLIKGKSLPVYCHFVLQLKPEKVEQILRLGQSPVSKDVVKSFTLNIKYNANNEVTIITATSFNTFIMDKSPDNLWDKYIEDFISSI